MGTYDELAKLEDKSPPSKAAKKTTLSKKNVRTYVPTSERTNVRTNERKQERIQIRHAFDIYEDQLRELQIIQLEAVRTANRKPKLGEMVRQAIDDFLTRRKKKKQGK